MSPTFTLREIADAVAAWSGRATHPGDGTYQRIKSLVQAGALVGQKPPGAGRTTARRFDVAEACYAGLLTILGDFVMAGQHGVNMRDGFFTSDLPAILDSIRNGDDWTATLRFAEHHARGPIILLCLHRCDELPLWPTDSDRPHMTVAERQILFDAPWQISGDLRALLNLLEDDE